MPALTDTLASYVPSLIMRRLASDPSALTTPTSEAFAGAVLFADISGFTALTEQLAQRGPAGAEQLSLLLNTYFGELVEIVSSHGGDIVKFAGDALIAIWPAQENLDTALDPLAAATLRATQCGQVVQARLFEYQALDDLRLSLRVSIGAGRIVSSYVGGVYGRWEMVVAGEPLVQINDPALQARSGDVVLSAQAWALISAACDGHERSSGSVHLRAVREPVEQRPVVIPQLAPGSEAALRAYIPGAILSRLAAGQSGWLAELRQVTILFINLPDLNHITPLDRSQAAMQALQTALYRYEGSINKLSVDDKGISLLAAFGLPPLSHEDDPVRGVQAALATQGVLQELGLRSAIGVTSGRAFCGTIGTDLRREYTMIGDVVNLAARLMQAAGHSEELDQLILCDGATQAAAQSRLTFGALPPLQVKGKAEPVLAYRPLGEERQTVRPQTAMVGRVAERTLLADQLQGLLRGGGGSVVVIEGEAGIGKSRLVDDLVEQSQALGITCLAGAGDAVEKSTPYYAWRPVFTQLLDLGILTDPELRRRHALDLLEDEPELYHLAPLLNAVLPLDIPENDLTSQLSGEVRAENTRDLLIQFLQTSAARSPKLLIVEDAQWLDSASWNLLLAVSERVRPLLLVLATRPLSEPLPPEYSQLLAGRSRQLRLSALSREETIALVCRRLGVVDLPKQAAELIMQKSEGHPFFSEELAYALRDTGHLLIEDGVCQLAPSSDDLLLDFPDTIQGVITSRIDRLTPQQQLALKVASVIGRVFCFSTLLDVYPIKGDTPQLAECIEALERLEIVAQETPEPEPSFIFRHAITLEVVYNLMLFAQRRELHRSVAEWHERSYAEDLSPYYPLLAHHWGKAEEHEKTIDYLELAGEQARRNYANQEAIRFLSEALALDDQRGRKATPLRRARWERQLGEAYYGLSLLTESRAHLERSLALLGWPLPRSRWALRLDLAAQWMVQSAHRLFPRRFAGRQAHNREELLEAARVHAQLGQIYYFNNETTPALYQVVKGLNRAEVAGPSAELARLYGSMSVPVSAAPAMRRLADTYGRSALEIAQQVKDLPALGWVLSASGMQGIGVGRWTRARGSLERSMEIFDRLGDSRNLVDVQILNSFIDYFLGAFATSARCYEALLQQVRDSGNAAHTVWTLAGQGMSLVRLGRHEQGLAVIEQALALTTERTGSLMTSALYGLRGVAHLRSGDLQRARQALDVLQLKHSHTLPVAFGLFDGYASAAELSLALWEQARADGDSEQTSLARLARHSCRALGLYAHSFPIGEPRARLWQGLYHQLAGSPLQATRAWQRSQAAAERLGMRYDLGLLHYQLGRHSARPRRHHHLAQACEIFRSLETSYDLERAEAALRG